MTNLTNNLLQPNLTINSIINTIFNSTKTDKEVVLPYSGDEIEYEIVCSLNTTNLDRDTIATSICNLDKDIEFNQNRYKQNKFIKELLDKDVPFLKQEAKYYDHVVTRVKRLMKLYEIGVPKIILENERRLLTTAIVMNGCCDILEINEIKEEKQYEGLFTI